MKLMVIISLLIMPALFFSNSSPRDYEELWNQVTALERKQPKKAYGIVQEIYAMAKKEKQEEQLIKCFFYKLRLSSQFEDKDPVDYILELEEELAVLRSKNAKAILHSVLGELWYSYGQSNIYRFQNRTNDGGAPSNAFSTLASIQKKSTDHYKRSLELSTNDGLEDFKAILNFQNKTAELEAYTINQLLVFRCMNHFRNSSAFVALPVDHYRISEPAFFESTALDFDPQIEALASYDEKQTALSLFSFASALPKLNSTQKIQIELYRLDYIKSRGNVEDSETHYMAALQKLIDNFKGQSGVERIYLKVIEYYLSQGQRYKQSLAKEYENGYPLANSWINKFKEDARSSDNADMLASLLEKLNKVDFEISTEQVLLPEQASLAYLKYRNISKLEFVVYRLSMGEMKAYQKIFDPSKRRQFISKLTKFRSGQLKLPLADDHNYHALGFSLEALPVGNYVIQYIDPNIKTLNPLKGFASHKFFVSNLSYVVDDHNPFSNTAYVVHRKTGEPIKNVQVEFYSREYNPSSRRQVQRKVGDTKTDSRGAFEMLQDKSMILSLSLGKDTLDLGLQHYGSGKKDKGTYYNAVTFTDRAIYRPGQLVFYKGILAKTEADQIPELVTKGKVQIELRDVNWRILEEETIEVNAFGSFEGVFSLPDDILPGNMVIIVKYNSSSFNNNIRVEEYKRPKIYAEMDKLEKAYALGDSIQLSGQVKSYSGSAVAAAQIRYRVERNEVYWRFGCYYPFTRNRNKEIVSVGTIESDQQGHFNLDFITKGQYNKSMSQNFMVYLDIVDSKGESTSLQANYVLSNASLNLSFDLPEAAIVGNLDSISIQSLNAESNPIVSQYGLTIKALKYPTTYKKQKYWGSTDVYLSALDALPKEFPFEAFGNEANIEKWPVLAQTYQANDMSAAQVENQLKSLEAGVYEINLATKDDKGRSTQVKKYLKLSSDKDILPIDLFWHSKLKSSYAPGEEVNLDLISASSNAFVLYRVHSRLQTYDWQWLKVDSKTKQTFKITEAHRGGFSIELFMIKHNRIKHEKIDVNVPWSNKDIVVKYETFRDKILPGAEEEWTLTFEDKKGRKIQGELAAALYDASLDQFVMHNWSHNFFPKNISYHRLRGAGFQAVNSRVRLPRDEYSFSRKYGVMPSLDLIGLINLNGGRRMLARSKSGMPEADGVMMEAAAVAEGGVSNDIVLDQVSQFDDQDSVVPTGPESNQVKPLAVRENLNELVFFYPNVEIADGKASLKFNMNEALTQWKLLLFGHNRDLQYVFDSRYVDTYKPLIVEPFLPRFFRQGDDLTLTAKVSNNTEEILKVNSNLQLTDALSSEDRSSFLKAASNQAIVLKAGESRIVEWDLAIPRAAKGNLQVVVYVEAPGYKDGEKNILAVISNREEVTESLAFDLSAGSTKQIDWKALEKMNESKSLVNQNFILEVNADPTWQILKALPLLSLSDKPTSIEIFNAYYALSIAENLLKSKPHFKELIKNWKSEDLQSPLLKNENLKIQTLLNTPWFRQASEETKARSMLKLLLNDNYIVEAKSRYLKKLQQRFLSNGGVSWLPGGRDNWYITQYILEGIGHLNLLEIEVDINPQLIDKAIKYVDRRLIEYRNKDLKTKMLNPSIVQYLYMRSFFKQPFYKGADTVSEYYLNKLRSHWVDLNTYLQAKGALAFYRNGDKAASDEITNSLLDRMVVDETLGNYWNDQAGYYWYQDNIEQQATILELFKTQGVDQATISRLKIWLLNNKRTNMWPTEKATALACYAFLIDEKDSFLDIAKVKVEFPDLEGQENLVWQQSGKTTGRVELINEEITANLAKLNISNDNEQLAWGSMYWKYEEDLSKVKSENEKGLRIDRNIYLVQNDRSGEYLQEVNEEHPIVPGSRIRVKIELATDRPMDFVLLEDLRSSGFEPVNVLSQYKWQDGLGYYEVTKDLSTSYYFDVVPKGNYLFEYDLFATHAGNFTGGLAQFQCFYAPEFGSHSSGSKVVITKP